MAGKTNKQTNWRVYWEKNDNNNEKNDEDTHFGGKTEEDNKEKLFVTVKGLWWNCEKLFKWTINCVWPENLNSNLDAYFTEDKTKNDISFTVRQL